jgi:hypothetical protein
VIRAKNVKINVRQQERPSGPSLQQQGVYALVLAFSSNL